MEKPTVYLCGSIQHVSDNGRTWRNKIKQRDCCRWLDPLDSYEHGAESAEWSEKEIVDKNLSLVEQSDYILVHWDEVLMCGTLIEIVYATEIYNIDVVVYTEIPTNKLSPWLTYHSTVIYNTFYDCLEYISERQGV